MGEAMAGRHQSCVQEDPPDSQHRHQKHPAVQIVAATAEIALEVVVVVRNVLWKNSMHLVVARLQGAA